jgi:hypothetical protein
MLPAVKAADATIRSLVRPQSYRIAFAPHCAFVKRRLELAVASQYSTFPSNEQQCAIDRSAGAGVSTTPITTSMLAALVAAQSLSVVGLGISTALARYSAMACQVPHLREGKERVTGQPCFAKSCDGGSRRASLFNEAAGLLRRRLAIKHHWCRLNRGKLEVSVASHGFYPQN